eukprot:GILJ01009264.1.p1 GENE.GILJ01009264.1~~GILJ01009264.1.p1  ORF type:complete len:322 (+),score=22.86 GILJ01009264.1:39-1004(+)
MLHRTWLSVSIWLIVLLAWMPGAEAVSSCAYSEEMGCLFLFAFHDAIAVLAIILSPLLLFNGARFPRVSLVVIGCGAGMGFCSSIAMVVLREQMELEATWAISTSIIVGLFTGLLVALCSLVFSGFGAFVLGAASGYIVALMLYNAALHNIICSSGELVLFIPFTVLGIMGGFLGLKYKQQLLYLATALAGAYMLLRGIGSFAGGYPNEFKLAEDSHRIKYIPWEFYLYFSAIIFLTIIGILCQTRWNKEGTHFLFDSTHYLPIRTTPSSNMNRVPILSSIPTVPRPLTRSVSGPVDSGVRFLDDDFHSNQNQAPFLLLQR